MFTSHDLSVENQEDFTEGQVTSIQTSSGYNEVYARHLKTIFWIGILHAIFYVTPCNYLSLAF